MVVRANAYAMDAGDLDQTLTIHLESSAFDTYLHLVDGKNGSVIAEDDDSGNEFNARIMLQPQDVPDHGRILILVSSSYPDFEIKGSYQLYIGEDQKTGPSYEPDVVTLVDGTLINGTYPVDKSFRAGSRNHLSTSGIPRLSAGRSKCRPWVMGFRESIRY